MKSIIKIKSIFIFSLFEVSFSNFRFALSSFKCTANIYFELYFYWFRSDFHANIHKVTFENGTNFFRALLFDFSSNWWCSSREPSFKNCSPLTGNRWSVAASNQGSSFQGSRLSFEQRFVGTKRNVTGSWRFLTRWWWWCPTDMRRPTAASAVVSVFCDGATFVCVLDGTESGGKQTNRTESQGTWWFLG